MPIEKPNEYLDCLIDPSFHGVKRRFVLLFENNEYRTRHTGYFLPKLEVKDSNAMIDGQNVFE